MKMKSILLPVVIAATMLLTLNASATIAVQFLAAGSSAQFNTFAFAGALPASPVCGTNAWSLKNGANVHDTRSSSITDQTGNVWVEWNGNSAGTTATTVCAYVSVDSGVGVRAFLAAPKAEFEFVSTVSSSGGTASGDLIPWPTGTITEVALPAPIYAALEGVTYNVGATDIRPEDAYYATNRALATLTTNRSGLGYGPGPVGTSILSEFSTKFAQPVQFALSGNDPISGAATSAFLTTSIGASPVMIIVNTTNTAAGHFGDPNLKNVNRFVLSEMYAGNLSRTRDLFDEANGALGNFPAHVMYREPISGTYNTFEWCVVRSVEVGLSQELGVTPTASGGNPLNLTNSKTSGTRQRAIGTGEEVAEVGATSDALGYTFWSFQNVAPDLTTAKYLTLDGVDPLYATYTNGTFPSQSGGVYPTLTFPNIQNGTYPAWSVLRVVTASPVPTAVQKLITAAITEASTITDFVPASSLNVFRSHYTQTLAAQNGLSCEGTKKEQGGDMGGAVLTVQSDCDYYTDNAAGLINLKQ